MFNLIKSVIRSFKKAKVALISLTFLIFLSSLTYSLLDNTNKNLESSYALVNQQGDAADLVINEKYDFGTLQYDSEPSVIGQNPDLSNTSKVRIYLSQESITPYLNNIIKNDKDNTYSKLINYELNLSSNLNNEQKIGIVQSELLAASNRLRQKLETDPNAKIDKLLNDKNINFERYESLDVSEGNLQKKIIRNNNNYKVNKLVLYEGQKISDFRYDYYEIVDKFIKLKNEFNKLPNNEKRKLITSNEDLKKILETLLKGVDEQSADANLLKFVQAAKKVSGNNKLDDSDYARIEEFIDTETNPINNNWSLNFQWKYQIVPLSIRLINPTSYFAIAAPGNWKFDQLKDHKQIFTNQNVIQELLSLNGEAFINKFNKIEDKYKIQIDQTKYLILGVGITPDLIYPIYSFTNFIPNPANQRLYYVNDLGYSRLREAFSTNPIETNIVARFADRDLTREQQKVILDEINQWASINMSWPPNLKAAYFSDDLSNILNLSAARTNFIPSLLNTIQKTSLMLTAIIILLALMVGILIVKNYIEKNRQTLGILLANGFNKTKINLSMAIFSFIPSLIGGIVGYTLGYILQQVAINAFSSFWFIPVELRKFSATALLTAFFLPVLIFGITSFLVSAYLMRKNVVDSLKNDSEYKVSKLSVYIKKPISMMSVMDRFRISIAFNSMWKLFILCLLSSATMLVLIFSLSTINVYEKAKNNTFDANNYKYYVDLATPTQQSGLIKYQEFKDLGKTDEILPGWENQSDYFLANSRTDKNQAGWANLHIVGLSDIIDQNSKITYLKNYVQSKIGLDYLIGIGILSANPWSLSSSLMPSNQAAASEKSNQIFLRTIANHEYPKLKTLDDNDPSYYIKLVYNPQLNRAVYAINEKQALSGGVLKPEFIHFLIQQFENIANNTYDLIDYKITYNLIGLDQKTIGDSKNKQSPKYAYTRIDVRTKDDKKLEIKGIKNWINTTDIKEVDKQNYLGPILYNDDKVIINQELFKKYDFNPIIINSYVAKSNDWDVGDEIEFMITNRVDRISDKLNIIDHDQYVKNQNVKFKIIGISSSARDNEIYTSYDLANKLLGFSDFEIQQQLPFNGYYSDDLDAFEKSTPLFSESGLFPSTSNFSDDNKQLQKIIKNSIKNFESSLKPVVRYEDLSSSKKAHVKDYKALLVALGEVKNIDDNNFHKWTLLKDTDQDVVKYIKKLVNVYGSLPYNTMINYLYNSSSNKTIFENISKTSLTIQNVIISMIVPIVTLIVILISNMLIDELKKIAIRMKALGFSDRSIILSFLSIYIPVFIFGLLVSGPLSLILVNIYNLIILKSASIALFTTINFGHVIGALLGVMGIFSISFFTNWFTLKKMKIAQEIKNY
ncbi:ABC transporter permease [Mycoplasma bradburyae]|uniref:ABC transporter permease n=1 Tax=Mycoplasma bradburyae TaxID=2963128 RepID=A0ABT5GAI2_9MOLU|nr:ABC transporter permease [Mycoplasma bradburyae]MDC4181848.1 ABC transporter permease [Mycoplasma bradburyae]UTS70147.1 ABC transporter permease [Mycoplasma bradburyae]